MLQSNTASQYCQCCLDVSSSYDDKVYLQHGEDSISVTPTFLELLLKQQ